VRKSRRALILFVFFAFVTMLCTGFYFADKNIKEQSGFLKQEVLVSADVGWNGNLAITVMGEVRTIEFSPLIGRARRAYDAALSVFAPDS
jgi:hypothetical protein